MSQLTSAAIHQGFAAKFFRWAYQANVIKTFESVSSPMKENGPESFDRLSMNMPTLREQESDSQATKNRPRNLGRLMFFARSTEKVVGRE